MAIERAEARRRGGHHRRRLQVGAAGADEVVTLRCPEDVIRLIERAATDALQLENSIARVRTLAALAAVAFKALEYGGFAERVATLEAHAEAYYSFHTASRRAS